MVKVILIAATLLVTQLAAQSQVIVNPDPIYGGGCWAIPAVVTNVHDVDTIHVRGPFGVMGNSVVTSIRINDTWGHETNRGTPEIRRRGNEATEYLRSILKVGDQVLIIWPYDLSRRHDQSMTLSRPLAWVYHKGELLNEKLIEAGHAKRDEKEHKKEVADLMEVGNG